MNRALLAKVVPKKYLSLYFTFLFTGLLLFFLFLRPGTVAGLTLEMTTEKDPAKADRPAGFQLSPMETVVFKGSLIMDSLEFQDITTVKLKITDPASVVIVPSIMLPLPVEDSILRDLTGEVAAAGGKGSLFFKVEFIDVVPGGVGYSYSYGYQATPADAEIRYTIRYTPASDATAGDYSAEISVFVGERTASVIKKFVGDGPNDEPADFSAVELTIPAGGLLPGDTKTLKLALGTFAGDAALLSVDADAGASNQNLLPILDRNSDGTVDKDDIELFDADFNAIGDNDIRITTIGDSVLGDVTFQAVASIPADSTFKIGYRTTAKMTGGDLISESLFGTATTTFRMLGPIVVSVGATLYPKGEDAAVGNDVVVLQASFDGDNDDIVSLTATGGFPLQPDTVSYIKADKIHLALRTTWGVDPATDFLAVVRLVSDATQGVFDLPVTAEDIAGNKDTENGAMITVEDTRDEINIRVLPGVNFFTPGIQCSPAGAACDGVEFKITEWLTQPVTSTVSGVATLADVFTAFHYYCPLEGATKSLCVTGDEGTFLSYIVGGAAEITTFKAGRGYTAFADPASFASESHAPQGLVNTPVPIKATFEGAVVADTEDALLPNTPVLAAYNLVGHHGERDALVGAFLRGAEVPEVLWITLHTFFNSLDIRMDSDGSLFLDPQGKPIADLVEGRYSTTASGLDPTKVVPANSASWLFMCLPPSTGPTDACEDGADLTPVLE